MLVAKFATNASGAVLLPNSVQVTESISGSVLPLAMFIMKIHHPDTIVILINLHYALQRRVSMESGVNGLVQAVASIRTREAGQARQGRGTAPTTAPGTPTSTATP